MANRTAIRALLDKLNLQIAGYQQALKTALRDREHLQDQLDKAGADDLVEPQPELPLEIGNELLITDEIVKLYKGLTNARGRVVLIDEISTKEHKAIRASAFGIQVDVNPENAQHMRAAYLQREQSWSPTGS